MSGAHKRICVRCDKAITGEAVKVEAFSASGARPDVYRHKWCMSRRPPSRGLPQYI